MKAQIKKLTVLGIVMMFASLGAIVYQGNTPVGINHSENAFQIGSANQTQSSSITQSFLESIAEKAYNEEKSWDVSHNVSVNFNLSDEISTVMNQWQLIYPKVLSQGGNPICCLGWSSNSSGNISISLIAKYIKGGNIQRKKSFRIERIDGTQQVVTETIQKSHVLAGSTSQTLNWDGYSFYDQGTKTKNVGWNVGWPPWPHTVSCNFNYQVIKVYEKIQIPSKVTLPSRGPSVKGTTIVRSVKSIPHVLSVWDSLSADSHGKNMVQAGVALTPNKAPCLWYEHYYTGANYGSSVITLNNGASNDNAVHYGDTISVEISCFSGDFLVQIKDINTGANGGTMIVPVIAPFTPYYFGSIVETPCVGGKISQLPVFSPFSVSDVKGLANNNCLYGKTAWSNQWYDYSYLQQSCDSGQNLNNNFQSSSTVGTYDMSLKTTAYCCGYDNLPTPCP